MGDSIFGDTGKILDKATSEFTAEFGRQLKAQRTTAGFETEDLCSLLNDIGVSLSVKEWVRLESGEQTEVLEPRLVIAFAFLLEFSIDQVVFACLRRAKLKDSLRMDSEENGPNLSDQIYRLMEEKASPEETGEDGGKTS